MIQRIQTVYWFIAAVLAILMLVFPWFWVSTSVGVFEVSIKGVVISENSELKTTISGLWLVAYCAIYIILNFAIIPLYSRRVLQARMSTIATFLALGFYALIALYRFTFVESEVLQTNYSWPIILPIIGAILDYMACRAVVKDEQKVRSLDRIR